MLNKHYNSNVNTPKDAETKALHLLRQWGYEAIQSPDWLARKNGQWLCLEAKGKELFTPGRNFGHSGIGLNISQVIRRTKLLEDFGVRTLLINFVPRTNIYYYGYLDELEKTIRYDTPRGIRIYAIENFSKGGYDNG